MVQYNTTRYWLSTLAATTHHCICRVYWSQFTFQSV